MAALTQYLAHDLTVTTEKVKSAYFREVSPKHALWHLDPLRLKQLDAPEAIWRGSAV